MPRRIECVSSEEILRLIISVCRFLLRFLKKLPDCRVSIGCRHNAVMVKTTAACCIYTSRKLFSSSNCKNDEKESTKVELSKLTSTLEAPDCTHALFQDISSRNRSVIFPKRELTFSHIHFKAFIALSQPALIQLPIVLRRPPILKISLK